jgi:hypothetical protein
MPKVSFRICRDPFGAGGPLPEPYTRGVTQSRILEIEGEYSLRFDCGDLPADAAVSATGHEPNGYVWEGVATLLAPGAGSTAGVGL